MKQLHYPGENTIYGKNAHICKVFKQVQDYLSS